MAKAKVDPLEVWEAYLAAGKAAATLNNPFVMEMRLHPHWQGYQPPNQEHVNALNWLLTARSEQCTLGGFQAHARQRGTIGAIGRQTDEFYDHAAAVILKQLTDLQFIMIHPQYKHDAYEVFQGKLVRIVQNEEYIAVTDKGKAFLTKRSWNPWVGEVITG
jgi:hypothetical protein